MTPAEDFFKVNPPSRLDFRSLRPPLPREFPESHPSGGCGFLLEQPIHLKKKYAVSQKKILNHVDGVSPVAVIKSWVPGISPATINVVPGNLHREIEEK